MNQTMSEADLIRLVEQFEVRHVIQSYDPISLFTFKWILLKLFRY